MDAKFTLKSDNTNTPYAWMLDNVQLSDIEDAPQFVEAQARAKLSAENYSDTSDDELLEALNESGELEEAIEFIREQVDDYWTKQLNVIQYEGVTFQDDYVPKCPICSMEATTHDFACAGEISYACGHYIGAYTDWADGVTSEQRWELAKISTHLVNTSHVLAGVQEWFFDESHDELNSIMTSTEIATRYRLNESTVRHAIRRGIVPARKSGDVWLIRRATVEEYWGAGPGYDRSQEEIFISEEDLGDPAPGQTERMIELLCERGWNVRYGSSGPITMFLENGRVNEIAAEDWWRDWNEVLEQVCNEI